MFNLEKLKDLTCGHEYVVKVLNWFEVLNAIEYPIELWDTFKREILAAARGCIGGLSEVTGWGRFGGDAEQYREESRY